MFSYARPFMSYVQMFLINGFWQFYDMLVVYKVQLSQKQEPDRTFKTEYDWYTDL